MKKQKKDIIEDIEILNRHHKKRKREMKIIFKKIIKRKKIIIIKFLRIVGGIEEKSKLFNIF
jgi:hypothetical protein